MPLPQRVDSDLFELNPDAFCAFLEKWGISEELGQRLRIMAAALEFAISITSGARSPQRQDELRAEGRPTADNDRSTHVAPCPATGADLWPSVTPINVVVARLGAEAVHAGLRWGGGSPVGSKDSDAPGIPSDWQHVDLGPVPM